MTHRIITAAACALLASLSPAVANAATDGRYSERALTVSYADLDLASDQGRATLDHRLADAVRNVCGSADIRNLKEGADMRRCRVDASKDASALREIALAGQKDRPAVAMVEKK